MRGSTLSTAGLIFRIITPRLQGCFLSNRRTPLRNFQVQSLEAEAFDKARQEMLRCFAALCHDKTIAREEITTTFSAMNSMLAMVNSNGEPV